MRGMDKYSSDYYRMTGKKYKPGLKSFIQRHLSHNLQFAYYYRKYKEHSNIFYRLMLTDCLENMVWRFLQRLKLEREYI